jgi:hypothetical protein
LKKTLLRSSLLRVGRLAMFRQDDFYSPGAVPARNTLSATGWAGTVVLHVELQTLSLGAQGFAAAQAKVTLE